MSPPAATPDLPARSPARARADRFRARLGVLDAPAEVRETLELLAHQVAARLTTALEEHASPRNLQPTSRRELVRAACLAAVRDFSHLVDPDRPGPQRSPRVLFRRLGSAEAEAGRDLDCTLGGLEVWYALWCQALTTAPVVSRTLLAPALLRYTTALYAAAEDGHLDRLRSLSGATHATHAMHQRPEAHLAELVDQWQHTTSTFRVAVRARVPHDATPPLLTAPDHVAALAPHPALTPRRGPAAVFAAEDVPASEVLAAYRRCLTALRLHQAPRTLLSAHGRDPLRSSDSVPDDASWVRITPTTGSLTAVARALAPLATLDHDTRQRVCRTWLHHLVAAGPLLAPDAGPRSMTADAESQAEADLRLIETLVDRAVVQHHSLSTIGVLGVLLPLWATRPGSVVPGTSTPRPATL